MHQSHVFFGLGANYNGSTSARTISNSEAGLSESTTTMNGHSSVVGAASHLLPSPNPSRYVLNPRGGGIGIRAASASFMSKNHYDNNADNTDNNDDNGDNDNNDIDNDLKANTAANGDIDIAARADVVGIDVESKVLFKNSPRSRLPRSDSSETNAGDCTTTTTTTTTTSPTHSQSDKVNGNGNVGTYFNNDIRHVTDSPSSVTSAISTPTSTSGVTGTGTGTGSPITANPAIGTGSVTATTATGVNKGSGSGDIATQPDANSKQFIPFANGNGNVTQSNQPNQPNGSGLAGDVDGSASSVKTAASSSSSDKEKEVDKGKDMERVNDNEGGLQIQGATVKGHPVLVAKEKVLRRSASDLTHEILHKKGLQRKLTLTGLLTTGEEGLHSSTGRTAAGAGRSGERGDGYEMGIQTSILKIFEELEGEGDLDDSHNSKANGGGTGVRTGTAGFASIAIKGGNKYAANKTDLTSDKKDASPESRLKEHDRNERQAATGTPEFDISVVCLCLYLYLRL